MEIDNDLESFPYIERLAHRIWREKLKQEAEEIMEKYKSNIEEEYSLIRKYKANIVLLFEEIKTNNLVLNKKIEICDTKIAEITKLLREITNTQSDYDALFKNLKDYFGGI